MEFCERCSSILTLKDGKMVCPNCGHKSKKKAKIESSEKIQSKEQIEVVTESAENSSYPIVEMKCVKCKNPKSYFWTLQTRAGDESETKFYKCVKCKHTWRVYR